MLKFRLLISIVVFFFTTAISAQETMVVGQVVDKIDKSPIPNVNVFFSGTDFYTQTDRDGYYLIKNRGNETKLNFRAIGYKTYTLRIKAGKSVAAQIEMEEKENFLEEILVVSGSNPAADMIKEVRKRRHLNDIKFDNIEKKENVVFLSKNDSKWQNSKIFGQFAEGNLSNTDSLLLVPLYMKQTKFDNRTDGKKIISENRYNTSKESITTIESLLNGINIDVDFYKNSISVLGKSLVSPLASVGGSFYRYYLTDSVKTDMGKEYLIWFVSKNRKNLAFNGTLRIDSATYALTHISAKIPHQANLNFANNLQIEQNFKKHNKLFLPQSTTTSCYITYQLLKDSIYKTPQLFVKSNSTFATSKYDSDKISKTFANSNFNDSTLQHSMAKLHSTPLYKTASYIADAAFTGYMNAGYVDIGKVVDIMRLTDLEGFRLSIPIKTNEKLWKNFMLGGYGGYGFREKRWRYGGEIAWRVPFNDRKTVIGISFKNDNRRTDYKYNDLRWQNNALETADENIVSTILSFWSKGNLSHRNEFSIYLKNDWNTDIESYLTYRMVDYNANSALPFVSKGKNYNLLRTNSLTLTGRFSRQERYLDDHFQRIYFQNYLPVLYATAEFGSYRTDNSFSGNYLHLNADLSQKGHFLLGEWFYNVNGGKIWGAVPYPLLYTFYGLGGGAYNQYEFAMINPNEYIADTYLMAMGEVKFNGIIFNNLPLIKHLNLRELVALKVGYGALNNSHIAFDLPSYTAPMSKPYSEFILGFRNLFGMISMQSIWRLTDTNKPNTKKWGFMVSVFFEL